MKHDRTTDSPERVYARVSKQVRQQLRKQLRQSWRQTKLPRLEWLQLPEVVATVRRYQQLKKECAK